MRAVWLRFRAEARARRWSWVALAALIAVCSGPVLAIVAGARRTDTAYSRFAAEARMGDFAVGAGFLGFGQRVQLDAMSRLPGVATTTRLTFEPAYGRTSSGHAVTPSTAAPLAPHDDRVGRTVDRWKLLDGRLANPRRADEAVVSSEFAQQNDVHVGSTVQLHFELQAALLKVAPQVVNGLSARVARQAPSLNPTSLWNGVTVTFHIVGIEAAPYEFPPLGTILPPLYLTRAFTDRYTAELAGEPIMKLRLGPHVDRAHFAQEIFRLSGGTTPPIYAERTTTSANVQRAIHLGAVGLGILAGLVILAVAFALAQAFVRQAFIGSDDSSELTALGMTRRNLVIVGVLRAGTTAAIAAVPAVVIAWLMSPIWPTGLARDAEPHPGLAADWVVFAIGAAAIVLFAVVAGAIGTGIAVRTRRAASVPTRHSWSAQAMASMDVPAPVAIGVEHTLHSGHGRNSVPVRSAMVATALAVATIVVAVTFSASTGHLLASPRLYGWTSDAEVRTLDVPGLGDPIAAGLVRNPDVVAVAAGRGAQLTVDGRVVSAFGLDDERGVVNPDLVEGGAPRRDSDIVLGTQTLRDIGKQVGDEVDVSDAGARTRMRVVGRALFEDAGDTRGDLGQGAQITFASLRKLEPTAAVGVIRVRFAPGTNKDADVDQLRADVLPLPVDTAEPPTTITSFGRDNNLPVIVAGIMLVIATAVLANAMVTSVRRRRRDFAILQTLGCTRRQLTTTVAAQATTFACIACLVGIPLGLLAGHWAWSAVANVLGIPDEPRTDVAALVALPPVLIVLTNIVALIPGRIARHTKPAAPLRAE